MSDFIKSLWPRNPFTWLGLILGAMSVLALIRHGFNYGFGPTFTLLLTYYESLIHALIGWWAEPIIKAWLAALSAYFSWDLDLYSHWKHVLVLMSIYFSGDWRTLLGFGQFGRAAIFGLWGLIVAFCFSAVAGIVPEEPRDFVANAWTAGIPVAGYLTYALGGNGLIVLWRSDLSGRRTEVFSLWAWQAFGRFLIGLVVVFGALQVPWVAGQRNPGLVVLGGLVIGLALYWVVVGVRIAIERHGLNEGLDDAFRNQGNVLVGMAILGSFLSAAAFVAANAGLRFYGL